MFSVADTPFEDLEQLTFREAKILKADIEVRKALDEIDRGDKPPHRESQINSIRFALHACSEAMFALHPDDFRGYIVEQTYQFY